MSNWLFKCVPVWLFLLVLLLGAIFTVIFGWSVASTLAGSERSGAFGRFALRVAGFPGQVRIVFTDIATEKDEPLRVPGADVEWSNFAEIERKPGIDLSGLMVRADREALARAPGWRVLVGVFRIDGELRHAALALSPELIVTKVWLLKQKVVDDVEPRPENRDIVHGFDVMSDGSVIFTFEHGSALQRVDSCGRLKWAIGGGFHHAVTLDERQQTVWAPRGPKHLAQVSTATGEVL
jgi:hypothetical protein